MIMAIRRSIRWASIEDATNAVARQTRKSARLRAPTTDAFPAAQSGLSVRARHSGASRSGAPRNDGTQAVGGIMADIPRLNGIIRALEQGQHALTTFSPAEIDSALAMSTSRYDGCVFEMEHNPWD